MNEIDLFCLDCGYNVRGLDGDPVRCPECGHDNYRADLWVPAKAIQRELRRMETGAALCGASAGVVAVLLVPFAALAKLGVITPPPRLVWMFAGFVSICCVVSWFAGVVQFRCSCDGKPGWWHALLYFIGCACVISVLGLGLMIIAGWFFRAVVLFWPRMPWDQVFMGIILTAVLCVCISWINRRGRAVIHRLQRETAAHRVRGFRLAKSHKTPSKTRYHG